MAVALHHFGAVENIQKLRKANFTQEQAESLTEILEQQAQITQDQQIQFESLNSKELATKSDIATLEADIARLEASTKSEIANVRTEIANLRSNLIYWILGTGLSGVLIVIGAMWSMFKVLTH